MFDVDFNKFGRGFATDPPDHLCSEDFGGSIEANGPGGGNAGGPGAAGGPGSGIDNDSGGGSGLSSSFGNGNAVDLGGGANTGTGGTGLETTGHDAATLAAAGLSIVGSALTMISKSFSAPSVMTFSANAYSVINNPDVQTAASHAAHDISALGAPNTDPNPGAYSMFDSSAQSIDAIAAADGGFASSFNLGGMLFDVSAGGHVIAQDQMVGGGSVWPGTPQPFIAAGGSPGTT